MKPTTKPEPSETKVTLRVPEDSIVLIVRSDGTKDIYCPETAAEISRCQMKGMVETIQELLEVLKKDICDNCDKESVEAPSVDVLPPRSVT
jgi:hypothetical protein